MKLEIMLKIMPNENEINLNFQKLKNHKKIIILIFS